MTFSETPSKEITLASHNCSDCDASLIDEQPLKIERRQVFDLPIPELSVTEYQASKIICLICGHVNQESFPKHVIWTTYDISYCLSSSQSNDFI